MNMDTNCDNTPVLSAYEDDQKKVDNSLMEEVRVWLEIERILDLHGYELLPVLSNGLPDMRLFKVE